MSRTPEQVDNKWHTATRREAKSSGWLIAMLSWFGIVIFAGLGMACSPEKPGAQVESEQLSQKIRNEAGAVKNLRKWFVDLESAPRSGDAPSEFVPIPDSLRSEWWRQAKASASWSDAGKLESITVRDPAAWEMIRIGRPDATPQDLGLGGSPPVFPTKIGDGIYAFIRYK